MSMNGHPPEDFELCEGCQDQVIIGECNIDGLCEQCAGVVCPVCKGSGLGYRSDKKVLTDNVCWRCLGIGRWIRP
jgi:hypothetical protein